MATHRYGNSSMTPPLPSAHPDHHNRGTPEAELERPHTSPDDLAPSNPMLHSHMQKHPARMMLIPTDGVHKDTPPDSIPETDVGGSPQGYQPSNPHLSNRGVARPIPTETQHLDQRQFRAHRPAQPAMKT